MLPFQDAMSALGQRGMEARADPVEALLYACFVANSDRSTVSVGRLCSMHALWPTQSFGGDSCKCLFKY